MPNSLRVVVWRMTRKTHKMYLAFGAAACDAVEEMDEELYRNAVEGLKMLPGYPGVFGDDIKFEIDFIDKVSNLRPN